MAIYHLSTKPVSRSSGRSAVASIAYRAGIEITDERLGKTYDYTKRAGVLGETLLLPNGWQIDRSKLWNLAEKTETRSNSRTAREIVINIPHELTDNKHQLAMQALGEFTRHLAERYSVAVDVAYHAPDKEGDNRNYHAHLLLTTRQIEKDTQGHITLGKKSQLEMSNTQLKAMGLLSNQDELKAIRKVWADIANQHLARAGTDERIDHRSHKDRGLDTKPTIKMGWEATALERKGIRTAKGDLNRQIKADNERINQLKSELDSLHETAKHLERTEKPVETLKNNTATLVPPTPKKRLERENRPPSERLKLTPSQQKSLVIEYAQKVEEHAKRIFQSQLKALQTKAKPILAKFEQLRDNKPLFFGKDQWQQDKDTALSQYNAIKDTHDTMRDKGVTTEHYEQAREYIAQHEPSYHAQVQEAVRELEALQEAFLNDRAKGFGADSHAQKGVAYRGKIIQTGKNGILQQTTGGIVYHPPMSGIEQGKSYTLENKGDRYTIQPDYEIRTRQNSSSKDLDR